MDKKTVLLIVLTIFLLILGIFTEERWILVLLQLEIIICSFVYDINKIGINKKSIINYINLIISIIGLIVWLMACFADGFFYIFIILVLLKIGSIMLEEISILKRNKKKILIIIAIIVSLVTIIATEYFILKKIYIKKVPFKIYKSYEIYNWTYFNEKEFPIRKVTTKEELDALFNEIFNKGCQQYLRYSKEELDEDRLKKKYEEYHIKTEEFVKEINIDDDFFDEYYLICGLYASRNGASHFNLDYITYNKINRKIELIKEKDYRNKVAVGPSVMGSSFAYFIKVSKEYTGQTIEWKTKYVYKDLFDI